MIDPFHESIGIIAAILTTSAFIPQVYKIYKEKNTKRLVMKFSEIANKANIHGLICSGEDLNSLKRLKKLINNLKLLLDKIGCR